MKGVINTIEKLMPDRVVYLPEVGLVYRNKRDVDNFLEEIFNAPPNKFLQYDKNQFWFKEKPEKVLVDHVISGSDYLIVPALDSFRKILKIYVYANKDVYSEIERLILRINNQTFEKVCLCSHNKETIGGGDVRNIFLKEFSEENFKNKKVVNVGELSADQKKEYMRFSIEPELTKQIFDKKGIGWVEDGKVAGILGPINYLIDPWGEKYLVAPYTEVLDEYRGKGIARNLWNSLSKLAFDNDAKYVILQTLTDSSADKFYSKNGFWKIGELFFNGSFTPKAGKP